MIFNMSTFIPGEKVYWYRLGDPETTSVRAARMNLTVDKLVKELDLALVDVDRITAELGASVAVTGAATYEHRLFHEALEQVVLADQPALRPGRDAIVRSPIRQTHRDRNPDAVACRARLRDP